MPYATRELLGAVAAYGLPGARPCFPARPLQGRAWSGLLDGVHRQRLAGQLLQAVADGELPATDPQLAQAAELHRTWMAHALEIECGLLEVAGLLDGAGVPFRVLKGAAFAHTVYRDPTLRVFGDLDIVVPAASFDEAVGTLLAHGYHRPRSEPRPGFDRRFGKGVTLQAPRGHELDLHRTLAQGPFGLRITLEDLFVTATRFELGGREVAGLGREEALLHACYHAALGNVPPRLVPLRDVAQHLLTAEVDENRALALARRWEGQAVVARALVLAWDTLGLQTRSGLVEWARRYTPGRGEDRALASYVGRRRGYGARQLAALTSIPRRRDRLAFLAALAFPRRDFVNDRGYARWWRRGGRLLLERNDRR